MRRERSRDPSKRSPIPMRRSSCSNWRCPDRRYCRFRECCHWHPAHDRRTRLRLDLFLRRAAGIQPALDDLNSIKVCTDGVARRADQESRCAFTLGRTQIATPLVYPTSATRRVSRSVSSKSHPPKERSPMRGPVVAYVSRCLNASKMAERVFSDAQTAVWPEPQHENLPIQQLRIQRNRFVS